jgi:hypothetical protein
MDSFSDRHGPPGQRFGPEIPVGVRRAITSWFADQDVPAEEVRRAWFQQAGYGDANDVIGDVKHRWGDDAATELRRALEADQGVQDMNYGPNRLAQATKIAARHVPAALFLDYLEHAVDQYATDRATTLPGAPYIEGPYDAPVRYINDLFAARGIVYRLDEQGRAEWHGDEGAYDEIVRPALDALSDSRFAGCRQEFEAALRHLRAGTPKDLEDAIEEAAKAVESGMKAVLDDRQVTRTGGETAEPLWNLLNQNGVVPSQTKDSILGTSRIRNAFGGHGQGSSVRQIPDDVPELAVRTAASALAYLAGRLT